MGVSSSFGHKMLSYPRVQLKSICVAAQPASPQAFPASTPSLLPGPILPSRPPPPGDSCLWLWAVCSSWWCSSYWLSSPCACGGTVSRTACTVSPHTVAHTQDFIRSFTSPKADPQGQAELRRPSWPLTRKKYKEVQTKVSRSCCINVLVKLTCHVFPYRVRPFRLSVPTSRDERPRAGVRWSAWSQPHQWLQPQQPHAVARLPPPAPQGAQRPGFAQRLWRHVSHQPLPRPGDHVATRHHGLRALPCSSPTQCKLLSF